MDPRPLQVLLVDDDPTDVMLTEEALAEATWPVQMRSVNDGPAALDYLRKQGSYSQAARPDIVWLDLNLPGMSGLEVLAAIRNDPRLKTLPVMVLSTSSDPRDVDTAYALHANCYSVKAVNFPAFSEAIGDIVEFWGKRVSLPS